jgi:hypothetical protein
MECSDHPDSLEDVKWEFYISTHNKWISNGKKEAFKKNPPGGAAVREKEEYAVITTH